MMLSIEVNISEIRDSGSLYSSSLFEPPPLPPVWRLALCAFLVPPPVVAHTVAALFGAMVLVSNR